MGARGGPDPPSPLPARKGGSTAGLSCPPGGGLPRNAGKAGGDRQPQWHHLAQPAGAVQWLRASGAEHLLANATGGLSTPVVQIRWPVGLAPVPQGPDQPFLGDSAAQSEYTVPSATSSGPTATLGAAQLSSHLVENPRPGGHSGRAFPNPNQMAGVLPVVPAPAARRMSLNSLLTAPLRTSSAKQYTGHRPDPVDFNINFD